MEEDKGMVGSVRLKGRNRWEMVRDFVVGRVWYSWEDKRMSRGVG